MDTNNNNNTIMRVTKRNGQLEEIAFDKILNRIKKIGQEVAININYQQLAMKVIEQLYDTISTTKIDELAAEQCASLSTLHPDYATLAGRIMVSNHQKNTDADYAHVIDTLYNSYDENNKHSPLVSLELWTFVKTHAEEINAMLDYNRDYLIDYFGFKTLERAYLFRKKSNNQIVERPQHMWMRVAICIHGGDDDDADDDAEEDKEDKEDNHKLHRIKETYDLMSQKYFTHATPTLFNAGTVRQQLSSCYLLAIEEDSIDGIFNTLKDCASISKYSGGIGLHINNVRAKDSHIKGTNGKTSGLVPMLRVFNNTARWVNQSGKRNGSFAIYLETWHADIFDFLDLPKNAGGEEMRARDLFYALWISDLFMRRVKDPNGVWSLFCPNECPGLADVWGDEFEKLYEQYESEGKARQTLLARDLWLAILDAQMETGKPYMVYKDASNRKSNQQNLGTIKSSNLCVAPETQILTNKGHVEIHTLVNQEVTVWNGEEWSEVTVRKTGEDQDLMDIFTDDGVKLTCTPYHTFYIQGTTGSSVGQVMAKDLRPFDRLIPCEYPIIDGSDVLMYPYTRGVLCGDGINPSSNHCYLLGEQRQLLHHLDYASAMETAGRIVVQLPPDLKNPQYPLLPSHTCSLADKLQWFAGFCDVHGCIKTGLQVVSVKGDLLLSVKRMLQTCGINPKVKLSSTCVTSSVQKYKLFVSLYELGRLLQLGFAPKRLLVSEVSLLEWGTLGKEHVTILKTEYNNRVDDTYCFSEPKRHMGIFNGLVTGQCTEIIEYSDDQETAVCNLASIALPSFVNETTKEFNYEKLHQVTKVVAYNLNRVIDINYYPTANTQRSNQRHRPVGIGVQGLADAFVLMDIPFHSDEAKHVNKLIFETIYHASLERSNEIAIERKRKILRRKQSEQLGWLDLLNRWEYEAFVKNIPGVGNYIEEAHVGAYSSFSTSPASQGILQFDMWTNANANANTNANANNNSSSRYDWEKLKTSIRENGLRNSLLVAPMPTASTSQIFGFNECFEPFTSNMYSRRTLAGDFVVINKYLVRELIQMGQWNEELKNNIVANKGSIQQLTMLPEHVRNKYKIVWEIPMKHVIDMAADRGPYICQSQSMSLWMAYPEYKNLTSMHFYAWEKGLKTGMYYLRRKARHQAQQFTIEPEFSARTEKEKKEEQEQEQGMCTSCSA